MVVLELIFAASFVLFYGGGVYAQVTPPVSNNNTLFTTMGFDGGGIFLSGIDCPATYLCPDPMETKSKVLPKWDDLNCQCDDACAVFGDCCINAKYYRPDATRTARQLFKCISMVEYQGLYMQTRCPETWPQDDTREKCEKGGVMEEGNQPATDPLSMTPVTSLVTRYTYQNFYCAYCAGDAERSVFWIPRIECENFMYYNATFGNITDDFVWSRLTFNNETSQWGVFLDGVNDTTKFKMLMRPPAPPPTYTTATNTNFVSCRLMVQMPTNVADLVRQCKPWNDDCPTSYVKNQTVRELCHSYTAATYVNGDPDNSYRNVHCAICNGEDVTTLTCSGTLHYRNVNPSSFAPSFAFLFDINENSGKVVGTVQRCYNNGEVYDPFFKICRQMVCANSNYKLRNGRCVLQVPEVTDATTTTVIIQTSTTSTPKLSLAPNMTSSTTSKPQIVIQTTKEYDVSGDVGHEMTTTTERHHHVTNNSSVAGNETTLQTECPRFNISRLNYYMYDNGSVYIEEYARQYAPNEYIAADDGSVLICMPLASDDLDNFYKRKFSVVLAYLTLACLGISLTCLVFHLAAFTQVPALRNLSGKNLASLCISLVIAYVTFIIAQFQETVSSEICTSVGVILYYSFLASFFWMNSISYDIWRTLRLATKELRRTTGQQWRTFVIYSAYSWFGSALVVMAAIVVENSENVPRIYKPSFGLVTCWFGSRRALLLFFVAPIILIVLFNVLMFALSAHIIVSTMRNSAILNPSNAAARRNFRLYLRLALIMGLSWVFGIVAGQIDREPMWYVFVILNALQGLFIFIAFTCTRKVRIHLKTLCPGKRDFYSSNNLGRHPRKFELEGRDSGSGESQSSQTSHLSLTKTGSHVSKSSTDTLY